MSEAFPVQTLAEVSRADVTNSDVELLERAGLSGLMLENERFEKDDYLDTLVVKPWGFEYRIYADNFYDVWKLNLSPGASTSLHCHPRKDTVLMCLSGQGRIDLIDRKLIVRPGSHVHIKRGVFHATTNIGTTDLELVEVENPRNKFDLLRVEDKYGRAQQAYELAGAEIEALARMQVCDGMPSVKYRPSDIRNRWHFAVTRAEEIGGAAPPLFTVLMGLKHSLTRGIEVLATWDLAENGLSHAEHCFTITPNTAI